MSLISSKRVPNEYNANSSILLVGESPGETEERELKPFVGSAGQLLTETLLRSGVSRSEVSLANLSQYRPQGNKFEILKDSTELQDGIAEIQEHINNNPQINVIVGLGAEPLFHLTGRRSIYAHRGSILQTLQSNRKCICTFHPSAVLRDRKLYPTFNADIQRIKQDSNFPELRLPKREYVTDPRGMELEEWTQKLCTAEVLAVDIESVKKTTHILCVGFAPSPKLGVCFVNRESTGEFHQAIQRILSSPTKKIFHYGTFDTEMLFLNGFDVNNYGYDTLVAQHILNPELPRSLEFLTSVYTREPYYKSEGRAEIPSGDTKAWGSKVDKQKLWIYNCKDICVTHEIYLEQQKEMDDNDRRMFNYEMSLIPVAQHIARSGMLVDQERREQFRVGLLNRWIKLQNILTLLCDKEVNVRSPKLKDLLYGDFKLPIRRNRGQGITTDEDAIVGLITHCVDYISGLKREDAIQEWNKKLLILKTILEIRGLRQLLSNYVLAKISSDGRYHSTYRYSNTETGRGSSEKYVDSTGVNAQTFPRSSIIVEDKPSVGNENAVLAQVEEDLNEEEDDNET